MFICNTRLVYQNILVAREFQLVALEGFEEERKSLCESVRLSFKQTKGRFDCRCFAIRAMARSRLRLFGRNIGITSSLSKPCAPLPEATAFGSNASHSAWRCVNEAKDAYQLSFTLSRRPAPPSENCHFVCAKVPLVHCHVVCEKSWSVDLKNPTHNLKCHPKIHNLMSSVYASEPATSGRVLFQTTHGPLEINLWCRECPTTTKLFLQLCLDGYYNDMIFHRIVPDFLLQTGVMRSNNKPTNYTREYQTSVQAPYALERRRYETHSRLRFHRRGQVAMALTKDDDEDEDNTKGDNLLQPQFFITLEEAPYLDAKHVLFGTVTGPTIYNALRIGKLPVNEDNNEPIDMQHAPRITSVTVLENPIHTTIVPHPSPPWKKEEEEKTSMKNKKTKKKRKGKKDVNVLSFGNELEEDLVLNQDGMQSSHDVTSSARTGDSKKAKTALRKTQDSSDDETKKDNDDGSPKRVDSARVDGQVSKHSADQGEPARSRAAAGASNKDDEAVRTQSIGEPVKLLRKTDGAGKREAHRVAPKEEGKQGSRPARPSKGGMSAVEARRAKYANKTKSKMSKAAREEATLAKLHSFQSKVRKKHSLDTNEDLLGEEPQKQDNSLASRMARKLLAEQGRKESSVDAGPTYHGQVLQDDEEDEKNEDWLSTKFKCRRHMDHSSKMMDEKTGGDGRNVDDYVVLVDDGGGERKRPRGGSDRPEFRRKRKDRKRRDR